MVALPLPRKTPITVAYLAMAMLAGAGLTYLLMRQDGVPAEAPAVSATVEQPLCDYRIQRINGYPLLRPLLFVEPVCASKRFDPMMRTVSAYTDSLRNVGDLQRASVYVREFKRGEWSVYNDTAHFDPGSMLKLPIMMTYLRKVQFEPGLLDRTLVVEPVMVEQATVDPVHPPTAPVQVGEKRTVRDLLERMIEGSDNQATATLMHHIDVHMFQRVFTDLGCTMPLMNMRQYRMTAREWSVFLKALYNGAYLGIDRSQLAMEWLTKSGFTKGMVAGLPPGTRIAHKFGEIGVSGDVQAQLHEGGIIFDERGDRMVVIMTGGPDATKLPGIVAGIMRRVQHGFDLLEPSA